MRIYPQSVTQFSALTLYTTKLTSLLLGMSELHSFKTLMSIKNKSFSHYFPIHENPLYSNFLILAALVFFFIYVQ